MMDPPRQEAITAIEKCKQAGIRPVMITGDHAITATAVARQLGILSSDDPPAIGGEELARMSDDDLREAVPASPSLPASPPSINSASPNNYKNAAKS